MSSTSLLSASLTANPESVADSLESIQISCSDSFSSGTTSSSTFLGKPSSFLGGLSSKLLSPFMAIFRSPQRNITMLSRLLYPTSFCDSNLRTILDAPKRIRNVMGLSGQYSLEIDINLFFGVFFLPFFGFGTRKTNPVMIIGLPVSSLTLVDESACLICEVSTGSVEGRGKSHGDCLNTSLIDIEIDLYHLSLAYAQITELPKSIGSLKHLRYLNLSQTQITCLPENVCSLYNLETLIVCCCHKLTNLPINFSNLKKLRHFDIRDTPLVKKMPLGLSELKSLQTLSKIIIGGDNGFPITKLKDLKNLHGVISIEGLDKVQDAMHARGETLLQMRLSVLNMEWSDVLDGSRKEALEKEVLNVLKPRNDSLKRLGIVSYGGIEFPNWVGDHTFHGLTHASIRGCIKCTSLPPLGQLPSLKELFIQGMDRVEVVDWQFVGIGQAFVSLETLCFEDMQGWGAWLTTSEVVDGVFPCLQELRIKNCPNLVEISLQALPSLRVLEINGCCDGVLRNLVQLASLVTKLEICNISGLNELSGGIMEHLQAVEEVKIRRCDEIRYLWESEAETCKFLGNLKRLEVYNCNNLVRLGKQEEDDCENNPPSLGFLRVANCDSIENLSCPNSIHTLLIFKCISITSVTFPRGGTKLSGISINGCEKLLQNDLGGVGAEGIINANMQMLGSVYLYNWSNLKSVIQLSCFIHLKFLRIRDCPSLESFPDQELPNLTSLKYLNVENCPSMDASFPRGLWPPNLNSLGIGGSPCQNGAHRTFQPHLLHSLGLYGGDVNSFSKLCDLLPTSLPRLWIIRFEKLESLSKGLQHLTSLQHLEITKMMHLPETLLPWLLSLRSVTAQNWKKGVGEEAPTGPSSPISPASR
ncbi:LOW QUALITY PROTEIN: hypothetical protein OSB04_019547 [Centaurea solstitialis]|uniref:Uncharacterized protein n=1 Tax=Centaurea solstitialis TaxID=347529 RepID=A0AA38SQJ5_9ASTR|nr:LOW QUALITY PROTEIN: hypothetical protein OSB04_019547 [Centaurea solstitialis]